MGKWFMPSGELKWDVLGGAFAGGAAIAITAWIIIHLSGASAGNTAIPYTLQSENTAYVTTDERPTSNTDNGNAPSNPNRHNSSNTNTTESAAVPDENQPNISVYISDKRKVENVPLEQYVLGVVAAEMPLEFEQAALEAQAMAARTYIVRRWIADNREGVPDRKALVTDQVTHQAYLSLAKVNALQETNPEGLRKARLAVERTRDLVLTYEDQPIEALFFSASNGYTEDSEEVFPNKLPYLRAVPSPGDKESVHNSVETVSMSLQDFFAKLDVSAFAVLGKGASKPNIRVLEWTEGHRVKLLLVGSVKLTGEEVRGKLGLRSASFDWKIKDGQIRITTYGNGHGVGMSQWGAEGMAKEGSSAEQIVEHYYSGARIAEASKLPEYANRIS
ncbi:stage II sporulation protein D [Cohnella yongneupensis]|uniref:Stage II sporulation protein D n=1 Tax=Cohnella yongneupensis TaxID=425006 RepID=A0ABW0R2V3_9BACL